MNVVVDTSVWIEFFRGRDLPILERAMKEGYAYITPVIVAEIMSGIHSEKKIKSLVSFFKELPLVEDPFAHWIAVGRLRAVCQAKGFMLSTPDAHIAQACLDLEASLYTHDAIFKKIAPLIRLSLVSSVA